MTAAIARAWTAIYTVGLPHEERDRRRQEIASDLWEQRQDEGKAAGIATRIIRGALADVVWRSSELRRARRLELMKLSVDPKWDWRMRFIGRIAIVSLVVFSSATLMGNLRFLFVTLPLGAMVLWFEIVRLKRDRREVGAMPVAGITVMRRRGATLLAVCVAVVAITGVVDALTSEDVHDRFWYLFVGPLILAFMVGIVALLMLGWSYLPRRDSGAMGSAKS